MKQKKTPLPKADPRGYENMRGSPMDVKDHPTYNKPDATEHYDAHQLGTDAFRSVTDALGPKTAYQLETSQIGQAVDISEKLRGTE